MSTLMAQIANKVEEAAALSAVTELVSADIATTSEKPGMERATVEVPAGVVKSLKQEIEFQLKHGNEFKETNQEERAKLAFRTAEFLTELLQLIEKGDDHHFKLAQVCVHSAKNSIQLKVPKDVYKFLVPSANFGKKLQEYFEMATYSIQVPATEGVELLSENVYELIQRSVDLSKARNAKDPKSEQAIQIAAHYMALLVSFMQVDKQTNTSGEEELRSYVPVGSMYRGDVEAALNKFGQFIQKRAKDLDFGRFDPVRVVQQYTDFLANGNPEQWKAVGKQLFDYFKQRESQQGTPSEKPQISAHDNYEMRAKAEQQGQQAQA